MKDGLKMWLSGVATVAAFLIIIAANPLDNSVGSVAGPGSGTDNAIARWDGTGASTLQDSLGVTIDDNHTLSIETLNTPMLQTRHSDTASAGSGIAIRRSRGTTIGGNTIVQDNDILGNLNFMGADGTNFESAALIRGEVDGSPSDGTDMPGALIFLTTPEASATALEALRIDSTGAVTKILQPCFLAYNAATDDNQTGNAAIATVDFSTEVYDQGGDFATDTFTAPVTGRYLLTATVLFINLTTAADTAVMNIVTSNRVYQVRLDMTDSMPSTMALSNAVIADMDASDTAAITLIVTGEASDVVDIFGSSDAETQFSGCLIS